MEEDFIHCMLFVTVLIIGIYIIIKPFIIKNNLPFNIKRTNIVKIDNIDVILDNISFNGVPAVVYQLYNKKTNITSDLINIINNNVSDNNEFEYYFLNEADAQLFMETNFEQKLLNIYNSLSVKNKNNLLKYCILYKNGGIYMDVNLSLNIHLSKIMLNNNIVFTKNKNIISNKFIIAPPNLHIFKEIIDSYLDNNPVTLSSLINKYNYNDNVKLYIDNNHIKNIDNNKIYININ